jgi:nucleotide-binding universal stress UspA family protein
MAAFSVIAGVGELVSMSIDQEMSRAVREAIGLLQAFRAGDTAIAVDVIETMDPAPLGRLAGALTGLAVAFLATCDHVAQEAGLPTRSEHILNQAMTAFQAGN